ncbi:MAG: ABC transporter permease [Candidatus Freyarchaeota archaeon]
MFREAWYITERELRHFVRRKIQVITSFIQPAVWLAFFGYAISSGIPGMGMNGFGLQGLTNVLQLYIYLLPIGDVAKYVLSNMVSVSYIDFLATGIVAATVMVTAFMSGVSIIWDKRFGYLTKLLVAPIPRSSIILGKMMASTIRSLIQALVVIILAILVGARIYTGVVGVALTIPFMVVFALGLSGFSVALGIKLADHEAFFGIFQMILLPLFFASPAIAPLESMPGWLQAAARGNPLTYAVDAIRKSLLGGQFGTLGGSLAFAGIGGSLFFDFAVLSVIFVIMVLLGAFMFRKYTM